MPDIDIDFADTRRNEVLNYVTEKYGRECVAQVITFGTMAARAAVRDVGRAMGYPYAEVDKISKLIPPPIQGRHTPMQHSIEADVSKGGPKAERILCLLRGDGKLPGPGTALPGGHSQPDEVSQSTQPAEKLYVGDL